MLSWENPVSLEWEKNGIGWGAGALWIAWKLGSGNLNGGKADTHPSFPSRDPWHGHVCQSTKRLVGSESHVARRQALGPQCRKPQCEPRVQTQESMKLESHLFGSLELQITDRDGVGFLGMVLGFSHFGNRWVFFLYFVEEAGMEPGSFLSPKLWNILIKTLSFPTNLCLWNLPRGWQRSVEPHFS